VVSGAVLVPGLLPLTRLYVWRLAPFTQLAGLVIASVAGFALLAAPASWRALSLARRAACAIGGGAVAYESASILRNLVGGYGHALAIAAAVGVIACLALPVRLRAGLVAATMLGLSVLGTRDTLLHPRVEFGGSADEVALYAWARGTELDAVVLTPPELGAFRLLGRRAIIADTKSPPLYPDELVAWYRRLCRVVDAPEVERHEDVERRYGELAAPRLIAIARELGASYVVLDKSRGNGRADAPVAFENPRYLCYRTGR
jgi:hypothetical protein